MYKRSISTGILNDAIREQNHLCFYCDLPFGTVVSKSGKEVTHVAVADHYIPWAYSYDNSKSNCVASCQICNSIKYSKIFSDQETARRSILASRVSKRIVVRFIPETPSTLDVQKWLSEKLRFDRGESTSGY